MTDIQPTIYIYMQVKALEEQEPLWEKVVFTTLCVDDVSKSDPKEKWFN